MGDDHVSFVVGIGTAGAIGTIRDGWRA